jgi:hypothetical protein
MILKGQGELTVQLPQGTGVKPIVVAYDTTNRMYGVRFINAQNADLARAVFWISEDLLESVKREGVAGLTV